MSDFDTRLRTRLQRLEAAAPEPRAPSFLARRTTHPNRRRNGIVLIAATAALLLMTSVVVGAPFPLTPAQEAAKDHHPEAELVQKEIGLLIGDRCVRKDEAVRLIRDRLDALGLDDWEVRDDHRYRDARCVGTVAFGEVRQVVLLPSMGEDVARGLDDLRDQTMARCLGEDEATDLLKSVLDDLGMPYLAIEVGEPFAIPSDRADAYLAHIASGCHVFAGAQFDEHGSYTFYVTGP